MKPVKILYLVTEDWAFCTFRLPVARAARARGWQIAVACRMNEHRRIIADEGFTPIALPLRRGSMNPWHAARAIIDVARLYRRERPDIVHHVAIQMCLIGTIAAALTGVPRVVNAFTGLGYLFTSDDRHARALRAVVRAVLRPLLARRSVHVIVQNHDDERALLEERIAVTDRTVRIPGSGVDTTRFQPRPEPSGPPVVAYVGRMLADKGLAELAAAARLLKARGRALRIILVGQIDPDYPAAIDEATLRRWEGEGLVEWWGYRSDIPAIWRQASIAVLPSYREGLPKSLLEAAACGVPMVATDVPGCREIVRGGDNGLLVPPRNPRALADAIDTLLQSPELRERFGQAARRTAEAEFSEAIVVAATLALYDRLLTPVATAS